ncbi:S-adenosyl-L-methionine-dependent methyltransferase [Parachaetomium inaequale]|uniref:tRNA (guanine(26)-N(2))-dimethyltransferase n=1 Tax=Parachaetomium inaequale TaxID=2588326 RepID=A0AAN6PL05_9PEZI|nr:S-adenosyl-L-methionine-dependent methyltransferase [Parachaetomium inaequale]
MSDAVPDLSATPAEGQRIKHDNVVYTTVREGLAHILVPEGSAKDGQTVQQVFYNPIQQFNRDLTILAMKAYGKDRIAQKQAAGKARSVKFADKKRKRREQAQAERPAKSPKLGENAATSADAQPDTAMPDATEEHAPEEPAEAKQPGEDAVDAEAGAPASNSAEPKKESKPTFTILDALSASGLRALRYAHEIPFATTITANDILKAAADAIERNATHNGLRDKINVSVDDALAHMYNVVVGELRRIALSKNKPAASEKYDIIDLDPYGSAAPFLDAAVQAVRDDGGLLCVTCTDSGVWASNGYPEKCYSLYGGVPVKGWYSHEVGIRLILHAIETSAARYGLAMEPLLSLSVDFYSRVFVRIRKSPSMVKFQGGKNMVVYSCSSGCGAWTTQLLMRNKPAPNKKGSGIFYKHGFTRAPTANTSCEHCGSTMHLAGPMYAGRIHSPEFVRNVIAETEEASSEIYGTKDRVRGMLQTALEEFLASPEEMEAEAKENGDETKKLKKSLTEAQVAAIDPYPFYFHPAQVSGILHCASPPDNALRGALLGLGYRVTRSHCKSGSMKTDAPWSVIWHVFREWIRQKSPVKEANIKPGSVAYRLLGLGKKAVEGPEPAAAENGDEGKTADASEATKPDEPPTNGNEGKKREVVFDEQLGRKQDSGKYVRYQMNPRENWGPMNRAKGK